MITFALIFELPSNISTIVGRYCYDCCNSWRYPGDTIEMRDQYISCVFVIFSVGGRLTIKRGITLSHSLSLSLSVSLSFSFSLLPMSK